MIDACELWAGGPVFRQDAGAKLSTDSVLLADFVKLHGAERGIDLGCGAGILSLLLLCSSEKLHMTGLELREEAAALARENLARNGFGERSEILTGDIREHRSLFAHGSFHLAVANPPYFPAGSGSQGGAGLYAAGALRGGGLSAAHRGTLLPGPPTGAAGGAAHVHA